MYQFIRSAKAEPNRNVFLIPFHFSAANINLHQWPTVIQTSQIILGNRGKDLKLLSKNEQGFTLKIDIWNKKSQLIAYEVSQTWWSSSVHRLKNHIVHIISSSQDIILPPTSDEKETKSEPVDTIAFVIHEDTAPYAETRRIEVIKDDFDASTIAHDRRTESGSFAVAVVFTEKFYFKAASCKLVKIMHDKSE